MFDIVAIIAMIAYALLGWLIIELLAFIGGTVEAV
jgi:hypothetical protein